MNKLNNGSTVGEGFNKVNELVDDRIDSISFNSNTLTLTRQDGSVLNVGIATGFDGSYITSRASTITQSALAGNYNVFNYSAFDYFNSTDGTIHSVGSGSVSLFSNSSSNYRIDVVQVNPSTDAVSVVSGTAASTPTVPSFTGMALAYILLYPGASAGGLKSQFKMLWTNFPDQNPTLQVENYRLTTSLNDLSNVNIMLPLNNQMLRFNATNLKWENKERDYVAFDSNQNLVGSALPAQLTDSYENNFYSINTSTLTSFLGNQGYRISYSTIDNSWTNYLGYLTGVTLSNVNNSHIFGLNSKNITDRNFIFVSPYCSESDYDQDETSYLDNLRTKQGRQVSVTSVTGNITLDHTHHYIVCTPSADITITLPAVPKTGQVYKINTGNSGDSATVTIDGNGKNIEGVSSLVAGFDYSKFELVYTGSEWVQF